MTWRISGICMGFLLAAVLYSCSSGEESPYAHPKQKEEEEEEEEVILPCLYLQTKNSTKITSRDEWVECTSVKLVMPDKSTVDIGRASVKGRGNSTWTYTKKPYALKFVEKQSVLGMPKDRRWDLLANYIDRTDMRNAIGLEIARNTKSLEWTPHGEFVELFLNGEKLGNYYLCEHIKIGKSRIGLDNGYILEMDTNFDESFKFKSDTLRLPVQLKDPDPEDFTQEQLEDIERHFNMVEGLIVSGSSDWKQYLDIDTFVDWWIAEELTQCGESAHPKSCYMYRDLDDGKGGQYRMGPVWDFDWGTFRSGGEVTKFRNKNSLWYRYLFADTDFVSRVKAKWEESKSDFLKITVFIDQTAEEIKWSVDWDKAKWPMTTTVNKDESLTFDAAVETIKTNYRQHLEWMDGQINDM